jgi:hypothetical protein
MSPLPCQCRRVGHLILPLFLIPLPLFLSAQSGGQDPFQKANNAVNKVTNAIAVFQPYLLKARELYFDARQMAGDVKNSAKSTFGRNGNGNITNTGVAGPGGGQYSSGSQYSGGGQVQSGSYDSSRNGQGSQYSSSTYSQNPSSGNYQSNSSPGSYQSGNSSGNYPSGNSSGANSSNPSSGNYQSGNSTGNSQSGNSSGGGIQSYLPNQSLPINNAASVNNDGTGNWGNQNNGLYGNCLDVLTGTVMGMGEAAQKPASVDLLFFAPADGQNTYILMTPGFARNNGTATYMTEHTSDQVLQWTDVTESEVALTRLTLGQFNQIQNNGQIQNAVRNAQNYSGLYTSVGQKLDGQVFAVKAQMENREVYALIAVIRQIGTSGNNGYLKIMIKSSGLDTNNDGQVDANAYLRSRN